MLCSFRSVTDVQAVFLNNFFLFYNSKGYAFKPYKFVVLGSLPVRAFEVVQWELYFGSVM